MTPAPARPEPTRPEPVLLDRAHLAAQTFDDADLAREVLELFREQMRRLRPLVAGAGDATARIDAAHTLKGSARGVGAARVAACAEDCEHALRSGAPASDAVARLERALAETDAEIARRLETGR
ncbi:Hpt domain-containing protein [Salinarimonas sp.]|uniref:Hpt domain-containing protein n=1 Tax=Salinarimonas sp. TaxID=2766526 RepID=UPI0032D9347C